MLYLLLFFRIESELVDRKPFGKAQLLHPNWLAMYWWLRDRGNWIQMAYEKLSIEQVTSQFSSPAAAKSAIDPELVKEFAGMSKGEGLRFPKEPTVSSRKLKVRVNKAAKEAKRGLDWAEVEDAFIARVIEVMPASVNGTANGTVTAPASEPTPPQTATSSRRS